MWLPSLASTFPWSTFTINVSGWLLVGALIVLISEVWSAHRLLRPFLGTGVLGGYTTFSTYTVEAQVLLDGGHARLGLAYLGATGQPAEIAPIYVFLASQESSYITSEVLGVTGGTPIT